MITLDRRDKPWLRRAIFIAATMSAAAILYSGVIAPIQEFFSSRESLILEQRELLTRLQSIAGREPEVEAAARDLAEHAKRGEFVVGPNEGVVNADLQTRLKAKAEQSGAQLRSIQALPLKTVDGVVYAGSRLEISGSLQAIQRTLYVIETGTPYHFITDAVIKPSMPSTGPGNPTEPKIEARLDIVVATQLAGRQSP